MISNSNILITGAGGFIGKKLSKFFRDSGNHVVGTSLQASDCPDLDNHLIFDIRDKNEFKKLSNYSFDHVFHLAALTNIRAHLNEPSHDFYTNSLGTVNLLEFFQDTNIRSINLISTVSVLDKNNKMPLSEDAKYGPSTSYGISKMVSELYGDFYFRYCDLPTRIIRLFNVYGPGQSGLVVDDLISKLLCNSSTLEILGDGMQIRDFMFVNDVLSGLEIIADKGSNGEIYNLGSGVSTSILELANMIISTMNLSDVNITKTQQNYKGEFLEWYADITKVKNLGFSQKVDLKKGIELTIEYKKKNFK